MNMIVNSLNLVSSTLTSSIGLWRGTWGTPTSKKPEKHLVLFDMEGCPFCRLVREALTDLDLDVMIYPCPKGGKRFRPEVKRKGGKMQFPYLVDVNTGHHSYESMDIIDYLFETYAEKEAPLAWKLDMLNKARAMAASISRGFRGIKVLPSKAPAKPLELYSFESSPYARMVRELMCQLEIPYLLHNVGKSAARDFLLPPIRQKFFPNLPVKGKNRQAFKKRAGKISIPYLIDPNTNTAMFESSAIKQYLLETYSR